MKHKNKDEIYKLLLELIETELKEYGREFGADLVSRSQYFHIKRIANNIRGKTMNYELSDKRLINLFDKLGIEIKIETKKKYFILGNI